MTILVSKLTPFQHLRRAKPGGAGSELQRLLCFVASAAGLLNLAVITDCIKSRQYLRFQIRWNSLMSV